MFISIEGVDRVGKDSFLLALDKASKWHTCNMMRGPVGCLTYDEIYNRQTPERIQEALSVAEAIKSTKHLIIYLYADKKTIEHRLEIEKQETGSSYFGPWSIEDTLALYDKNLKRVYEEEEILRIDTSHMSIQEEVELALSHIEKIQNTDMQLISDTQQKDIKSPNKGNFEYYQYKPYHYDFTKDELSTKASFDISVDEPYYNMMYATLTHLLYEHKLGWINDRQLIYTSKDCIPFVQFLIHKNTVEVFVHQRSCDIEKHKLNDIMFFDMFCREQFPDKDDFIIHYTCAVPHKYILSNIEVAN